MTEHIDTLEQSADYDTGVAESGYDIGFGNQCNEYVDVIQQALDLALGNTGNLAPDSAVVDALDELYITARNARASALLQLLVPLNQVLRSAEQAGFTLSQADTLLVQEAIIAITLGIDSIVNQKPTPILLSDVTQRMIDVAAENKHEIRANSEATGLVNVFVSDADELLQRLFEQIQRWRASAFVGRGFEEVNRLLSALHDSAETAGLSSISTVVRRLLNRMQIQRAAGEVPNDDFFDLAIETVEVLGDDLDRIRNNEQLVDHTELYEKLGADMPPTDMADFESDIDGVGADTLPVPARESAEVSPPISDAALQPAKPSIQSPAAQPVAVPITDIPSMDGADWPDRNELIDVLREISQGNKAIKERLEQLRRTLQVYPDARRITSDADEGTAGVSAVDGLFFKIDSLLSRQRKSVTNMASVLGVDEQQTAGTLAGELGKLGAAVRHEGDAANVVLDGQLHDHLSYAIRALFESHARGKAEERALHFKQHDGTLTIYIDGVSLPAFAMDNARLRSVDTHMLKSPLPGALSMEPGESGHLVENDDPRRLDQIALAALQRLIDIAAYYRGRIATEEGGGRVRVELPVLIVSEEVLVFRRENRLYGVPGSLTTGIQERSEQLLILCEQDAGSNGSPVSIAADAVLGKQTVSVTSSQTLMLGAPYRGAFLAGDSSLVLVLDPALMRVGDSVTDRWL
jgi:hypothetical protein